MWKQDPELPCRSGSLLSILCVIQGLSQDGVYTCDQILFCGSVDLKKRADPQGARPDPRSVLNLSQIRERGRQRLEAGEGFPGREISPC